MFELFFSVDDTSDSDSEIVITTRSKAELNRADTLVHQLFLFFKIFMYVCIYSFSYNLLIRYTLDFKHKINVLVNILVEKGLF